MVFALAPLPQFKSFLYSGASVKPSTLAATGCHSFKIQRMKNRETLILTKGQTFWHYSILPLLLVMPVLTTIDIFKYYVTHTYTSVRPIEDLISIGYIWVLPAIAFFFIQKRRLK